MPTLDATGAVRPCCFHEEQLGVCPEASLREIYNNDAFRELRRSLLDSDLSPSYSTQPLIGRAGLEAKVTETLARGPARGAS